MSIVLTNNLDLADNQLLNPQLQQLATDPAGKPDGHFYYNTTADTFRVKLDGSYAALLTSPAQIDHNSLQNYEANRHIDHSAVSLSISGTANQVVITSNGNGDITTNRSWVLGLPQDIATTSNVQFGSATLSRAGVPLTLQNTTNSSSVQAAIFQGGNRTTAAANDEAYVSLFLEDSDTDQSEFGRIVWRGLDVAAASKDGSIRFDVMDANVLTNRMVIGNGGVSVTGTLTVGGTAVVLSSRTITAGSGLTGGGDLSTNRTLSVDINGLTADATPETTDYVMTYDVSAGGLKKVLLYNLPGGSSSHNQNTDTGTTSTSFAIDSGGTGVRLKNDAGVLQIRNLADDAFADIRVNNLIVEGTTTTINSETLTVNDNIIVLNNNVAGSPSEDAGVEVERGTSANAAILWREADDWWEADDGTSSKKIARTHAQTIGNGTDTSIAVTHNLGTRDVVVQCYRVSDNVAVLVSVVHTSTTTVTLSFSTAPTSNQYRVVVTG